MVISNGYGQVQTPVESNSDYTAVAAAIGGAAAMIPTAMLQGALGAISCNTADGFIAPIPPGAVYATVALMQKNQPQ